nr:response regulator transcription factor [Ardenticatena sp.]
MAHILLVEDETSIADIVRLYLERDGHRVAVVDDGAAALHALETTTPDLIVLDLMLPHVDGWHILRWVRSQSGVPIIILTARREEPDRIAGLDLGADDYVVKPFSPQELVSRVRAVLRRTHPSSPAEPLVFDGGALVIDPGAREVRVHDEVRHLTVREFDLLWVLASHPRQAFSRDRLLSLVWGSDEFIDPGTVTVHIRRVREKIEPDPSAPRYIKTVWGVGYRFEGDA